MRKSTAIILSLFYLMIATETSVAIHKCMGSIQSIDLVQTTDVCCCGDMSSNSCCENEVVELPQDEEEKVISTYSFSFENEIFVLIELPTIQVIEKSNSDQIVFAAGNTDPPNKVPAYLKNCSFTFYG